MDRQTNINTDGQTFRKTDGLMDSTDKQKNRWLDGQIG
jgi:hypothetical protein